MSGTFPTAEQEAVPEVRYQPGQVIANKYRLEHILGEGGMGTVWRATNLLLEVDVAIKLLRVDMALGSEGAERFLREARATAKLIHPAVVRLHDFGTTQDGLAFIVMEHLPGQPLFEVVEQRGALPAIEAVQLLMPVIDALQAAHRLGIVHRDLKPDNILLVSQGAEAIMPKVVDFGVARDLRNPVSRLPPDDTVDAVRRQASRLTEHGALLGSPHYMAPEQACGREDVDGRADVWAIVVCLYECVTGKRPFDGLDLETVLLQVITHAPTQPAEVDDALWAIMERGLTKDRDLSAGRARRSSARRWRNGC